MHGGVQVLTGTCIHEDSLAHVDAACAWQTATRGGPETVLPGSPYDRLLLLPGHHLEQLQQEDNNTAQLSMCIHNAEQH